MNNWEKFLSKKYNKPFYYDKIKNKSLWSNNYNITIDNLDSEEWEEQKSSSGNKYFYNKKTGISQWKIPVKGMSGEFPNKGRRPGYFTGSDLKNW